jgi:hypothetical protein
LSAFHPSVIRSACTPAKARTSVGTWLGLTPKKGDRDGRSPTRSAGSWDSVGQTAFSWPIGQVTCGWALEGKPAPKSRG